MTGNDKFKSYVTSTAFSLSLSKNMVDMLLSCEYEETRYGHNTICFGHHVGTLESLSRRGLIEIHAKQVDDGGFHRYVQFSEAGRLLCQLLKLAGFKHEPYPWEQGEEPVHIPEPETTIKNREP